MGINPEIIDDKTEVIFRVPEWGYFPVKTDGETIKRLADIFKGEGERRVIVT